LSKAPSLGGKAFDEFIAAELKLRLAAFQVSRMVATVSSGVFYFAQGGTLGAVSGDTNLRRILVANLLDLESLGAAFPADRSVVKLSSAGRWWRPNYR
jgi:hypothetical protein